MVTTLKVSEWNICILKKKKPPKQMFQEMKKVVCHSQRQIAGFNERVVTDVPSPSP